MTLEIGYVLFLIVVALVLFATEILTIDVIGLVLLLALTVPGIIAPGQALAGFGSETIIVLIGLFVLTAGVTETGVVERIGLKLAAFGSDRPKAMTRMLITLRHRHERLYLQHHHHRRAPAADHGQRQTGRCVGGQGADATGLCLDPGREYHRYRHLHQPGDLG
jgi:hypothetical protein